MVKNIIIYCLIVSVLLGGLVLGCGPAAAPEAIVLKAVTSHPVGDASADLFLIFVDRVNKAANGELIIDYKGGPEAIPGREQAEAISKGTVDIGESTCGLSSTLVPEALAIYRSGLSAKEQREGGLYDAVNKYFIEANLFYTGLYLGDGMKFAVFTSTPVEKPGDLKGLMMRSTATYDPLFKALGCNPVSMPHGEVYTAMERGVVNGFAFPMAAIVDTGLHEVCTTAIDHLLWNGGPIAIMNLNTWQALPKNLQKLMMDVVIEFEDYTLQYYLDKTDKARATMKEAGVEFVKFSAADAKWYIDTANRAVWEDLIERCPETAPALKKLAGL